MAIRIPIISEFNGKGIDKAIRQFNRLETNGQRAGFILKKAGKLAAVGIAGIGTALAGAAVAAWSFAKMAMEDQKSQIQLAKALKASAKATDAQVKSTEKWITKTQLALGIADDKLRPALARLVRSTGDVSKAQKILNTALDVSAATGRPLEAVVAALGRAYDGNKTALGRLGLGFSKAELKAMSFNDIMLKVNDRFGGSASAQANTFAGRMERLKQRFNEMKESLGYIVVDLLGKFLDFGDKIGKAYGQNGAAGAIGLLVAKLKDLTVYTEGGNLNKLGKLFNIIATTFNVGSRGLAVAGATMLPLPNRGNVLKEALTGDAGTMRRLRTKIVRPDTSQLYAGPEGQLKQSNGQYINITVNTGVGDPVAIGREISKALRAYNRRAGAGATSLAALGIR